MESARVETIIYVFIILSIFGCGAGSKSQPEFVQTEQIGREVTSEMVAEYAMIHQMSDLKTAEYYLTHPAYAREHPYIPTPEDLAFYERSFLESMYPQFEKQVGKDGYMRARSRYMNINPHVDWDRSWKSKYRVSESFKKSAIVEDELAEATRLYKKERFDDAIKHMETAVQARPDSPTLLYDLGVIHMKNENYPEAVKCFQSSLEQLKGTGYTKVNLAIHPKVYMGACTNLGLIYTRIGMYDEAVEVLKEAIQFEPSDVDANWNLGTVYWFMGDMESTAAQMRRYITLDPDNAEAHNIIGLIYYRKDLRDAALDEFQTAAKLNPSEKQYSYNEGLALAKLGRYDEASQAFKRASGLKTGAELRRMFIEQLAANKVRKLYNDGCTAMESLNITQAIKHFEAAVEIKPDMVDAHVNLGVCYRRQGNKQKQIHHFEEAVRLKSDMPNVRYNLGLAYSDSRMYSEAMLEFRRAIELEPSLKDAHFKLGMMLCKAENYAEATGEFEKCLELSPNWYEAYLNLGTCYLKTGKVDDAIYQFKEAVRQSPNSAEAHYNLGAAYMRIEKFDEVSRLFQKALEIDPGYRQARIKLKELEAYQGR